MTPGRLLEPLDIIELIRSGLVPRLTERLLRVQSRPNWAFRVMSGLPPIATEEPTFRIGSFVPIGDIIRLLHKTN